MPAKQNLPKYFTISQDIIKRIKTDEFQPGMQILSENEIIDKYGVSNTTARKVLQEIESSGWVTKIKGRGTYVRPNNIVRSANKILSFTNNMIAAGYHPSTKVLHKGIIKKDFSATINGRLYRIKGPLCKIHRLRFADDVPMMLEVRYISLELCPGIVKEELEGSLYKIYENKYLLKLKEVNQMLSAIMLSSEVAGFFNLQESVPAILVEGVTFCGREIILEMERSIYRGDKYRFAVRAN